MPDKPNDPTVAKEDVMQLQLATARVRAAVAEMQAAQLRHEAAVREARELQAQMVERYGLNEGDAIDASGQIKRADNGQAGAAKPASEVT